MTSTDSSKNLKSLLVLTPLSVAVLLFPVTANAKNCLKLNYKSPPLVIVSGLITTHHKLPKDSEGRTGDGPWLTLDQPLLVDHWERPPTDPPSYASCYKWQKIAILPGAGWDKAEAQIAQIKNWDNQHVTIDGELDHFDSGLVSPNVYIRVTTIKKD
jgi:hypothetical protein